MRRLLRVPRVAAPLLLLVGCLLGVGFLKVRFRFGVETHFQRYPPPPDARRDAPRHHPDRPWFMKGGLVRPQEARPGGPRPRLWPHEEGGDRIVNQLMYVPAGYASYRNATPRLKRILLYFGRRGWSDLPLGRRAFLRDRCPVDTCEISTDVKGAARADLVLFKDKFVPPEHARSPHQIWLLFLLECPQHTPPFAALAGLFNWTATYRHDSDVVAPYEKFVPYPSPPPPAPARNYASGKSKKVAWFVSNCNARNRRLQYARQLARHIGVDMFGKCGTRWCPRNRARSCFQMLDRQYKFYLAFENSNCRDYITEKFFVNGLGHDVLPIVMGARPEDYVRAAPPHSYLHVEQFGGPESLARHLRRLDADDALYNAHFRWKGSGEFIDTRFWCRLCALLHAPVVPKVYTDLHTWWAGKGTCTSDEWRRRDATTP